MKLYQTYRSPFPTRVRLMLYTKGIDAEIVTPHGFHGDAVPKTKRYWEAIASDPIA
jgi:glutathione S-transferase